jgi:Bacterial toxin 44
MVLLAIRRASLAWKALVGTGNRYDFKNDKRTMQNPSSEHCPKSCDSTIALCPHPSGSCFGTDLPGNLFYATVGRFVGFTELSLQLGSQFAQLESTSTWDPPEDTAMISIGFGLPDPLDGSSLCSAMSGLRNQVRLHPCVNCDEPTRAQLV